MTFQELVKPSVLKQPVYEPGKPIEDVARELGLNPASIIKLASNENPFGPSPKAVAAAAPEDDRQMHGMVEAGIGTGGYRSFGAAVSLPVGENGRLDLAYREGRNEPYLWGYPGAFSPVYGLNRYPGYGGGRSRTMSMGFSWSKDRQAEDDRWGDGPRGGLLD